MRLSVTPKRCGEALDVGGFSSEGAARSDRGDRVEIGVKITQGWIRQGGEMGTWRLTRRRSASPPGLGS